MLNRKLLRDLVQLKGQVLTIALVVACGITIFVAALSTYESLLWSQRSYYETARFGDVYARLKRAPATLIPQIREIPGVAEVEARVVYDVTLDVPDLTMPAVGRLIGVPAPGQPTLNRLHLRRGRLIEATGGNEVVISEGFATANHLEPGSRIQAVLNGRRETLHIVGIVLSAEYVFALRGTEPLPDDRQFGILWMNQTALATAFNMEGAFNDLVLTLAPHASERSVIAAIDRLLEQYGGLGAHGRDLQISHRFLRDEIREQEVLATTIPPIFLMVAAFLLNVVLSRIVATQREQIAALKALGYSNLTVGIHYLKMACAVVLVGSVVGVLIGAWLGKLMTGMYVLFFHFPVLVFRLQPWVPVLGLGISFIAAGMAAVSAVRRVVTLPPAEAMRPPTPLRYRRAGFEEVWPLRRLSPQGRMVLRSIVRRPLRAVFTTLGLALAVPILVLALFWQDALDYMITVQFSAIERGDATVTFTEPISSRAQREIARMPGVLETEGFRVVPVRLRAGHRSYQTGLLGLPEDATLRRLLDEQLQVIPLPSSGLLLTDRLGDRLGVGVGDVVTVEALEGTRVKRDVFVTRLVNDMMGLSAYMRIANVNRLMSESDTISAVSLTFDQRHEQRLYRQLKELPQVATVIIKRSALRSFTETTAKFILVFTGILTIFAVAIAVGVVYNNARVALAERSWELASLRVLGFTRGEVSSMLLRELTVELLAAIPLGLWLGYGMVVFLSTSYQAETFRIPVIIELRTYVISTLIVVLAGVLSALVVRRRIDHLDLVSVLKTRE
ncbi:MAG: ABC transporter permease [Candidatus Binatia bacterium]